MIRFQIIRVRLYLFAFCALIVQAPIVRQVGDFAIAAGQRIAGFLGRISSQQRERRPDVKEDRRSANSRTVVRPIARAAEECETEPEVKETSNNGTTENENRWTLLLAIGSRSHSSRSKQKENHEQAEP